MIILSGLNAPLCAEARVVASRWKQALLGVFLVLLGVSFGVVGGHHLGKQAGIAEGLTDYHNMCYNNGGFIMIEEHVVLCTKQGG